MLRKCLSILQIWMLGCMVVVYAQSELPRNIPGIVASGTAVYEAALGFYLPTDFGTGTNYSAAYEATTTTFALNSVNMTAFCSGYTLTSALQVPTLIRHTFAVDNSSFIIELVANNSVAPIACTVDANCQTNNTFWKNQWPQYMLPNNASNPCAFCFNSICMGHVDVSANGTILTQPSVCPYSIKFFKDSINGTVSIFNYPTLPMEASVSALYGPINTNATNLYDCQLAAISTFGANGEIYSFNQAVNSCSVAAACNVAFNRPSIFYFSNPINVSTPFQLDNAIVGAGSARGTVANTANISQALNCTTGNDCLENVGFVAGMSLFVSDPVDVLNGKPNTTGSAQPISVSADAICLNNYCRIISTFYPFQKGPLGWNDTTLQPDLKCNLRLQNVVVDLTGNYDLNVTLFNRSRFHNPCTAYETNVDILEVYSTDCPSSIQLNNATGTYQITVPANASFPANLTATCHLSIRCAVNTSAYPYDCSGPQNNATYTTNVRGVMYDTYYLYNGILAPALPPTNPPTIPPVSPPVIPPTTPAPIISPIAPPTASPGISPTTIIGASIGSALVLIIAGVIMMSVLFM